MNEKLVQTKEKNFFNELKSLAIVVLIALLIRTTIFQLYFVPTGSMNDTILNYEYLFSTQYSYGYSKYSLPFSPNIFSGRIFAQKPERGDIVIFRPTKKIKEDRYVKRLIGMPGDKIQVIDDVIHVNDQAIERQEISKYINEKGEEFTKFKETLPNGVSYYAYKTNMEHYADRSYISNTEAFYVPEDQYFFMGDNRDNSKDSRYELGCVPFENFIAKARFIIFSTKECFWDEKTSMLGQISRIYSWLASTRANRILKNLYILD